LCKIEMKDGGSEIYREGNQRYVAVKYSVRGRDLGSTVEEAISKVGAQVQLPRGYHINWEGEYESEKRAAARLFIIVPLTILIIFVILYTMFQSIKWAVLIIVNVMMTPLGGMLALLLTNTHFSVSSGVGFLALFGVSVQTGVIMLEYINQLRVRGHSIYDSAVEGAVQRLRPIMMTTLVASIGLLPAATSRGIGSDSQKPFAIVIVGGLLLALLLSVYLLPTLYVWIAGERDVLQRADLLVAVAVLGRERADRLPAGREPGRRGRVAFGPAVRGRRAAGRGGAGHLGQIALVEGAGPQHRRLPAGRVPAGVPRVEAVDPVELRTAGRRHLARLGPGRLDDRLVGEYPARR